MVNIRNMSRLKVCVLYVQIVVHFLLSRPFGTIIHDIADKYGDIDIRLLRKLEKVSLQRSKAELDIAFLKNCKLFRVFPKFLQFRIPYGSGQDVSDIRKRLLKNALRDRYADKNRLDKKFDTLSKSIKDDYRFPKEFWKI